jgi:Methyltransferase domain
VIVVNRLTARPLVEKLKTKYGQSSRTPNVSRAQVLRMAVEASYKVPGNILEFGVANGDSTRTISKTVRRLERTQVGESPKKIFACDSFEGMPEKYENLEVGYFACKPPRIRGVEIVKGYFQTSLTPELAQRVGRVALASLDADLFSSTLCALTWLTPLLGEGSLLLFDEYLGGDNAEKRAHEQWQQATGVRTREVARFAREPAGFGETPDERVLFEVTGCDEPSAAPAHNSHEL